jgi:molecular chaperone GrpE
MCEEIEKEMDNGIESECGSESEDEKSLWKKDIIDNCRLWLSDLQEAPDISGGEEDDPDLYSFYEQLCVLRNEFRKNSRRSHELFSRFGEHLEEFQGVLDTLMQRTDRLMEGQDSKEILARHGLLLQMVELYERLRLLGGKLDEYLISDTIWQRIGQWIKRLFTRKRQTSAGSMNDGFSLTLSHFEGFLVSEGVSRIQAAGAPFDPSIMVAVGTVETDEVPPDVVFEEISGGYLHGERVLALAKVTVTKRKGS